MPALLPPASEPTTNDMIACQLTPPGRSALAVVGVRGPGVLAALAPHFTPRGCRPLAERPDGSVAFGRWGGPQGEELLVVRRAAGDVEIHCHGGAAAVAAILGDLRAEGCTEVAATAWQLAAAPTASRLENRAQWDHDIAGERERIAAEARLALAKARGPQAAQILAHQLSGSLASAVEAAATATGRQRKGLAERLLSWQRLGLRLTQPWRVVVAGPPNAGKSSLVNALAGFSRSIVSPIAGTTRDVLETRLVLGGWDVLLLDTAGLRLTAGDAVEQAGIHRAVEASTFADLVIVVSASDQPDTPAPSSLLCPHAPRLFVTNKSDLLPPATPSACPPSLHTSALTGAGIQDLADQIITTLIPRRPPPGEPIPFTQRQTDLIQSFR